ncbi:M14 family metallopeptidase [Streptococcus oricebi]|uniref:Zinc carboxypeptidase n=1 Tax=Streptococcus oricebi TaxID=1547447 RepID=A0ABS5B6B3_9STRE|nr:M14 family metallopeptidase [Streptococcus oricebi]MBP2624026.1 zinc carboxypeptidase [Streptococcus oricebi]
MKDSYKKRLFSQVLSLSTACLLAVLVQGQVAADSLEVSSDSPQEASLETNQANEKLQEEKAQDKLPDNSLTKDQEQAPLGKADHQEEDLAAKKAVLANQAQADSTELADSPLYMSEKNEIKDQVQGAGDKANDLTWTLDNKPLNEWKSWNLDQGDFSGPDFIKVKARKNGQDLDLTIETQELFGQDLSLREPSNIRRSYRAYMGQHQLVGRTSDQSLIIRKNLIFRPYESFHTHEEMLAAIEQSRKEAKKDRLVQIETIGRSAENREVKLGIISKDQASIDHYLRETSPRMLTSPDQVLEELKKGQLNYKLPVLINNTHADEQPAIDIITRLFHDFATKDSFQFPSKDAQGQETKLTFSISELLERFIFLFNFTENPDGDVANTRALANGLDPNRDAGYQANPETRIIAGLINKWNPMALYDIHGFVKEFLIEPATPPHDPNFEYDLMADLLLENAHSMGRAGVANSKYDSYIIPKLDWGEGWDDSFSGYTGVYALYHGILGHTIEIPEGNQASFDAGYHAVLGGIDFLRSKPDQLMEMRLKFYSRGINKIEAPEAEKELVGPNGEIVGRIKNGRDKFFPDYYVIPMSLDKNNALDQAFKMIDYFKRNGVIVQELKEDTGPFKKGDLVVDMAQAKRGYANHILYSGSNESKWGAMYAELVVNFPDMKGFKAYQVFEDQYFAGKLGEVTSNQAQRTSKLDYKAPYYILSNNSESAVKAVNQALAQGKEVYLTEDGYILDTASFDQLLKDYPLYGQPLYKQPLGTRLKPVKVYSPNNYAAWAGVESPTHSALVLKSLGFNIVNTPQEADVILLENSRFDASILGLKPTIVVGGSAMQRLEKLGVLEGFDAERFKGGSDYEGLMRAIVDDLDPLASGYAKNDLFYSNSGNWIEKVPANFRTLMKIADSNYYIAGWWPQNELLANKTVAIAGSYQGQTMFIYAGNPSNRLHPVHFYRWLSNAIFGSQLATLQDLAQDPGVEQVEVLTARPQARPLSQTTSQGATYQAQPQVMRAGVQLPQTGSKEDATAFLLAGLVLATSSGLILLKKKEEKAQG